MSEGPTYIKFDYFTQSIRACYPLVVLFNKSFKLIQSESTKRLGASTKKSIWQCCMQECTRAADTDTSGLGRAQPHSPLQLQCTSTPRTWNSSEPWVFPLHLSQVICSPKHIRNEVYTEMVYFPGQRQSGYLSISLPFFQLWSLYLTYTTPTIFQTCECGNHRKPDKQIHYIKTNQKHFNLLLWPS